jgi:hypothetical protein
MPEETLAEDAADGEGREKARSPHAPVARAIARALWLTGFKAANPDAANPEINAAWKSVRQTQTKPVLQALKTLERRGYTFSAPDAGPDDETTGQA